MKLLKQIAHLGRRVSTEWNRGGIRTAVGKYIILYASALHLAWAGLLVVDKAAGGSTPVHALLVLCGGAYRTAAVLTLVAILALVFTFIARKVSAVGAALMLIPQQAALLVSAGAGIRAIVNGQYADGVARPASSIASDQMSMMLLALLYTIVIFEATRKPVFNEGAR